MIKHSIHSTHLIYHWWNDDSEVKPYQDLANPIILSIATLRANNRSMPITVLDLSRCNRKKEDWGNYPSHLNFEVVQWQPLLDQSLPKSSRLCSRVWDVWAYSQKVKESHILFTDCDIFWLSNPLPLNKDKNGRLDSFYCSSNTGVWYFDRRSEVVKETFRLWKSIIAHVLIGDKDFYQDLVEKVPSGSHVFQDEVAFGYFLLQHPELYRPIDVYENFVIDRLRYTEYDVSKIKCLHLLSATVGQHRGRACMFLRELRDSIERVLSPQQISEVFGSMKVKDTLSISQIKTMTTEELRAFLVFTGNTSVHIPDKPSQVHGYFVKELGVE